MIFNFIIVFVYTFLKIRILLASGFLTELVQKTFSMQIHILIWSFTFICFDWCRYYILYCQLEVWFLWNVPTVYLLLRYSLVVHVSTTSYHTILLLHQLFSFLENMWIFYIFFCVDNNSVWIGMVCCIHTSILFLVVFCQYFGVF